MNRTKLFKASIVCSALVPTVLVALPSAAHYRASLYEYIPFSIQFAGAAIIAVCTAACIWFLAHDRETSALLVLLPVLTLFSILPFLPQKLGYIGKYSDMMNHIGTQLDILATGTIPDTIYPAFHIYGAQLHLITDVTAAQAFVILSTTATVCFLMFLYLLSRSLSVSPAAVLVFAPIVIVAHVTVPSSFTYMTLFPLGVYLFLWHTDSLPAKSPNRFVLVALIVVFFVIWSAHVIPGLILLGLIVLTYAVQFAMIPARRWTDSALINRGRHIIEATRLSLPSPQRGRALQPMLVYGLVGFLWASVTIIFDRGVGFIAISFTSRATRQQHLSTEGALNTLVGKFGFSVFDFAALAAKRYGGFVLVCAAAGVGVLVCVVFARYLSDKSQYRLPIAVAFMIVGSGLWSVTETFGGLVPSLNFIRALRPVLYVGIVASGMALLAVLDGCRHLFRIRGESRSVMTRTTAPVVATIVILLVMSSIGSATVVAAATAYNSPFVFNTNRQYSQSDVAGMDWYFTWKNRGVYTTTLWRSNDRYAHLLLRPNALDDRRAELNYTNETTEYRTPAHFGRPGNETFGATVGCRYYIEGTYDRTVYLKTRSAINKFSRSDFERLSADPSVRRLYSNGNVNISLVGCN